MSPTAGRWTRGPCFRPSHRSGGNMTCMKTICAACKTVALIVVSSQFCPGAAYGDEIRVMTSGAFSAAYLDLVPQFESTTKDKIVTLATSMGTGARSIPNRLKGGEPTDVVIVDDAALDALIKDGRVLSGTKL